MLSESESESEVAQSCPTLCDPMDSSLHQAPPMGFSRQEYWNGLPLPSPGRYLAYGQKQKECQMAKCMVKKGLSSLKMGEN